MKRAVALSIAILLSACAAAPEDRYCRRTADILDDPSYYQTCLKQRGL